MRSSPRARAAFLLLYGALLAWQIDRWFFTPHGVVSTWPDRQSSLAVSAGSPRGISQTFTMHAEGLDGVWLRPMTDGRRAAGELVIDLLQVRGEARFRVERVSLAAETIAPGSNLRVPFRPIRLSRERAYQIDIRHLNAGNGPALDFLVTREDALRDGRLFSDGVEQWGDLVFETSSRRATLPYWIHEVLRPWPPWVSAWPTVVIALALFNAVLAWACAHATGLGDGRGASPRRPDVNESALPSRRVDEAAVRRTAMMAAGLIAVIGVMLAARPTGRYRSLDLIDALPDARIETTWPVLHGSVAAEPVVIFGRIHRAIVALPTSAIRWEIDVPSGAVLRFGAAMRPDMWTRESDGIQMRVRVEHGGVSTTVADYTLVPRFVEAHKALHPGEVSLQRWTGQRVSLVFETTPERFGNAVNDVPVWVAPRIEWPRDPAAGVARVVRP